MRLQGVFPSALYPMWRIPERRYATRWWDAKRVNKILIGPTPVEFYNERLVLTHFLHSYMAVIEIKIPIDAPVARFANVDNEKPIDLDEVVHF